MNIKWLNKNEFPFKSKFYESEYGNIHYIDEGKGKTILFVHGNPSWSFEYRHLIKELSDEYRCISIDHLGFGLSDKPADFDYLPKSHYWNLKNFIHELNLKDITLYLGDWGGPIGLAYAVDEPQNIQNIIITNTWAWSVKNELYYKMFSGFVGGPIGKFLIKKYNFFAKSIVKQCFGDKKKLTKEVHNHYIMPLKTASDRKGNMVLPKEIIASSSWLDSTWKKLELLKEKNILIAWGMKDIAFRKKEMEKFMDVFKNAKILEYQNAGHFLAEEVYEDLSKHIKKLIK